MAEIKKYILPSIITMIIVIVILILALKNNQANGSLIEQNRPIMGTNIDLFENARIPREGHYLLNHYYLVIEEFRQINRCLNNNDLVNAKNHLYIAEDIWAFARTIPMPTDTITNGFIELKEKILNAFELYLINDSNYGILAIQEFYKILDDYYYYLYD